MSKDTSKTSGNVMEMGLTLEELIRRKRSIGLSWRMDETYVKVGGHWKYLCRAVDKAGDTIDFLLRAKRDHAAARAFFERAIELHGVPAPTTSHPAHSGQSSTSRACR